MINCAPLYIRWIVENLTGLMKSAILVYILCVSTNSNYSIDQVKRSFYRAANGIFAKVGRLASDVVMVQVLKQKCLPILLCFRCVQPR